MATNLEQLIGLDAMLGTVQQVKRGVPESWLPPAFLRVTKRVNGVQASYKKVDGTRVPARRVEPGSPSVRIDQGQRTRQPVTLIQTFENESHEEETLANLQADDDRVRREASEDLDFQTAEFFARYRNLRVSAVASALSQGMISFNANGVLQTSTSTVDVDFGIPAGHQNQLDILGDGAIIDASWNTAGTDIVSQLTEISSAMVRKSGYAPKHVFYGANIPGYLAKNTAFQNVIKGNQQVANAFKQGIIPDGTAGMSWHPATDAYFEDADGTGNTWFGGDTIVLTPDPSPQWWQFIEGGKLAPTRLGNVGNSVEAQFGNVRTVRGFGTYCALQHDPISIVQYAFDTFLPIIANPYAVAIGDVTP